MVSGGARLRAAVIGVVIAVATATAAAPVLDSAAATTPITTTAADLKSVVSATPSTCAPAVHASTDALATHKIDDEVQIGATMFAVGSFTSATPVDCATHKAGPAVPRSNVMAFNIASGAVTPFAPVVNGEVWSVLPSATHALVYLCGSFTTADGVARRGVAKYNVASGVLDPTFNPQLDGACSDLKFIAGRLVVMGSFKHVGSAARTAIAYINQTTGATDAGTGYFAGAALGANVVKTTPPTTTTPTRVYRGYPNPRGTALVIIGNFGSVGGKTRHQIAMIGTGATSTNVAPWYNTGFDYVCKSAAGVYDSWLRDVAWSPDGKYFVVGGTGGAHSGTFCDSIMRFGYSPSNANETPTWHMYTDGDTIHSVAVTSAAVYFAGHQRYIDPLGPVWPQQAIPNGSPCDPNNPNLGVSGSGSPARTYYYGYNCPTVRATYRPGIGALNPSTGAPLSWNPMRTRNEGAKSLYVSTNPDGLWVGSDGQNAGCATPTGPNHDDCTGQTASFVGGDAFFPLAPPTAPVTTPAG
jgi:beta-propeller uncharacterized protein DUF5122